MMKIKLLLLIFLSILFKEANSQDNPRIKVFLDCANTRCFNDYFRSEINLVDFYRDQNKADVHVLITDERNASQGRTYQMIFFGQNELSSYKDTISFSTEPNATDFQRREAMTLYLKLGLAPFVAKTSSADQVDIVMKTELEPLAENIEPEIPEDNWNYWVYRLRSEGRADLDQNRQDYDIEFSFSASQVLPKHRTSFRGEYSQNIRVFNVEAIRPDSTTYDSSVVINNHSANFNHLYVKGLSQNWSIGYFLTAEQNTFSNFEGRFTLTPAIEYSFFPYDEFNNRLVTLRYSAGLEQVYYYEETIYNEIDQLLPFHRLRLSSDFNQRWGNIRSSLTYSHYLHDLDFYSVRVFADFEVRVTGALSLNLFLFGEIAQDQLNILKGSGSIDDVITRRRELQSNFNFSSRFGVTYRFGSLLNNFVNPRFD